MTGAVTPAPTPRPVPATATAPVTTQRYLPRWGVQTGLVQNYALLMVAGVFVFLTVYLLAR